MADAYAANPGVTKRASPVETFTMRPPSAISGSSLWVRKNGPLTWMFMSRSNCASVVSAMLA